MKSPLACSGAVVPMKSRLVGLEAEVGEKEEVVLEKGGASLEEEDMWLPKERGALLPSVAQFGPELGPRFFFCFRTWCLSAPAWLGNGLMDRSP